MSWKGGPLTGNALSFPAAGQTWPALTGLYLNSSTVATPKNITGTVDANGKVDLAMDYDLLITVASSQCRLTGTTQLSSQGVETLGGQAPGKYYDPATEAFATVKLPKKIKPKGKTVLLNRPVITNAGQQATAKLSWSTKKSTKGSKGKHANQEIGYKTGKVAITTKGKAKRLYLKLTLKAPEVDGYQAYSFRSRGRRSGSGLRDATSGQRGETADGAAGCRLVTCRVGAAGRGEPGDGQRPGERRPGTEGHHSPAAAAVVGGGV